MESFGSYLKSAREAKKISLPAISRATKIRRAILEDIERDHGEFLLPEVVIKNFIEAYARAIGLDPKDTLSRYRQWRKRDRAADQQGELPSDRKPKIPPSYIVAGAIGLVVIIICSLLIFSGRSPRGGAPQAALTKTLANQKRSVPSGDPHSSVARSLAAEQTARSTPAGNAQAGNVSSPAAREHTLVIKASERTWIQIQEGSSSPLDIILFAGDNYTRKSARPMTILIGNAGGVQVTFDGKIVGGMGGAGEVVKLKLPAPEDG
jgi:cytoskeletal protein RodZ